MAKLFYVNRESSTIALQKLRTAKELKPKNDSILYPGIGKLVKQFKETGSFKYWLLRGKSLLAKFKLLRWKPL